MKGPSLQIFCRCYHLLYKRVILGSKENVSGFSVAEGASYCYLSRVLMMGLPAGYMGTHKVEKHQANVFCVAFEEAVKVSQG